MSRDYDALFREASKTDLQPNLEQSIQARIYAIKKRRVFAQKSAYGLVSLASFVGILYSGSFLVKALISSGVYDYVSLMFSSTEALAYWKEMLLSVAESLPFFSMTAVFAVASVFLWSMLKAITIKPAYA